MELLKQTGRDPKGHLVQPPTYCRNALNQNTQQMQAQLLQKHCQGRESLAFYGS